MKIKLIFIALLFVIFIGKGYSQIKVEANTQINIPFHADFSLGVGAGLDIKYMINNNIGVGLVYGFQHFFMASDWKQRWYEKWSTVYTEADYNLMPFRASFTYLFSGEMFRPYIGLEAGVNRIHWVYSYKYSGYGELTDDYTETHIALAPNAGIEVQMGKRIAFDLNLKYNGFDQSFFSGKAGIILTLGEVQ
jgi:outer membrane protein W